MTGSLSAKGSPTAPETPGVRPSGTPALETLRLTMRFGSFTAVDQVTFSVPSGVVFGLVGPNGAGKSTTIKMLVTLLPPTSGTARVAGFDVVSQSLQVRRSIGYVPQLISADDSLSGYENLLIFAKLYDIPRGEREGRIRGSLAFMGLTEAADLLVRKYSGGMIRRLEIAQAMLHRPPVLLMDEPTVGLDPVARHAVWEHVQALRRQFGTTILLTTHYMEEADILCDTVAIMHRGRIAAIGSPAELKAGVAPDATLDDVFVHYTGSSVEEGGGFKDVVRTRRTARRVS